MNSDRHRAPTTFPESLFQYLTTFTVKKFFLICSLNLVQLCAIPICTVICYEEEETGISLSTSSPQEVVKSNEVTSQSLLFSRLDNPSVLSLFSWNMSSSPFNSFVALIWMLSSNLTFFYTVKHRTEHNIRGEAAPTLNTEGESPLLTCQLCCFKCILGFQSTLLTYVEPTVTQNTQIPFCWVVL